MKPSEMVEMMYKSEESREVEEATNKTVSVNLSMDDAALLKAISERMGDSVYSLGGEIIRAGINEMLWAFTKEDQIALAKKADEYVEADFKKKGIKREMTLAYDAKGPWEALVLVAQKYDPTSDQMDIHEQIEKGEQK